MPVEQFCTGARANVLSQRRIARQPASAAAASRARARSYLRFIPRNEMDIAVVGAGVARDAR